MTNHPAMALMIRAAPTLPGMPSVRSGIRFAPTTAELADSAAAIEEDPPDEYAHPFLAATLVREPQRARGGGSSAYSTIRRFHMSLDEGNLNLEEALLDTLLSYAMELQPAILTLLRGSLQLLSGDFSGDDPPAFVPVAPPPARGNAMASATLSSAAAGVAHATSWLNAAEMRRWMDVADVVSKWAFVQDVRVEKVRLNLCLKLTSTLLDEMGAMGSGGKEASAASVASSSDVGDSCGRSIPPPPLALPPRAMDRRRVEGVA